MPVHKLNKDVFYDIVVKSLRRREVTCRVPAVTPPKGSNDPPKENISDNELLENPKPSEEAVKQLDQNVKAPPESEIINKNESPSTEENRNPKSVVIVEEPALVTPISAKRPYRRRTLNISSIAQRLSATKPDLDDNAVSSTLDVNAEYQRKKGLVLEFPKQTDSSEEGVASPNAIVATPITTLNRKTPQVPHNTPVIITCCEVPQASSTFPILTKRKRGRPSGQRRLPPPPLVYPSEDEESTCSMASQSSQATKVSRRSKKMWYQDLEDISHEEEPLSEYELLQQRNIEENAKILSQLFIRTGLGVDENKSSSSDTPRTKKVYNRLPLPPPRPKSARLEDRRSTEPLDFSRLSQRLSLPKQFPL